MRTYVECACTLNLTIRSFGTRVTVITNAPDVVRASTPAAVDLRIVPFEFELHVPEGVPFRSAHHKLDVIRGFASGKFGTRPALIDLDIIALNAVPIERLERNDLLAYDITDQMVSDIGRNRILEDLNRLLYHKIAEPIWFGGEFICATQSSYASLWNEIKIVWPKYLENIGRFSHHGDETVVTAALVNLAAKGVRIGDAGAERIIKRWWSARTTFKQDHLQAIKDVSLWHLPAGKPFIASLASSTKPGDVLCHYQKYVKSVLWRRRALNPLLNTFRRERKHVACV